MPVSVWLTLTKYQWGQNSIQGHAMFLRKAIHCLLGLHTGCQISENTYPRPTSVKPRPTTSPLAGLSVIVIDCGSLYRVCRLNIPDLILPAFSRRKIWGPATSRSNGNSLYLRRIKQHAWRHQETFPVCALRHDDVILSTPQPESDEEQGDIRS